MATCCSLNCTNPNALEYQKCWKPQHNAGCSCTCINSEEDEVEESTITIVRNKFTRSNFV